MRTTILFVPGHGSSPDNRRSSAIQWLAPLFGFDLVLLRFDREEREGGIVVQTVSEELRQAKVLAKTLSRPLIVAGHSQGGPVALGVALAGLADGYVSVMGDPDAKEDVKHHLQKIGKTLPQVRKEGFVRFEKRDGRVMWYTPKFFEDYAKWDIARMTGQLDVPSLFIAGRHDEYNTPAALKKLAKKAEAGFCVIDEEHRFNTLGAIKVLWAIRVWWKRNAVPA